MKKRSKYIKIIRIFSIILCFSLLIFSLFPTQNISVLAESTSDLNQKLNDLSKQIDQIKKQKQDIQNQIQQENSNQGSLSSQISIYNSKIQSLQLDIDQKNKSIQSLHTQIKITQNQAEDTKAKIALLNLKILDLSQQHETRVQTHFQNSFHTTFQSLFENNFETFLVQREFSNSLAKEDKLVAESLNKDQSELTLQQIQLTTSLQQQQTFQDQAVLEQTELNNNQTSLSFQKSQKTVSLQDSIHNESQLNQKKAELDKIGQDAQKQLDAYLLQIISVRGSGTTVHKGDVIGRMGRTGFVLTGIPGYYPDPITEPCGGVHTHFEVAKNIGNGVYQRTNPLPYMENGTISPPYHSYTITQYYGENISIYGYPGHPGIDYYGDQGCGTPIYSGVDGVIKYYCRPFQYPGHVADPTYLAVIYDPVHDINVTYMHLKKATGSC